LTLTTIQLLINRGRQQYNEAVQKSFREELLLNLVRLRYRESPEFLSVGGIAAQYTFDGRATGSLSLPNAQGKSGSLFGGLSRTERPTISYVPARGEAFQKGLLAPIDLVSLELLSRTGWSWERILRTSVQYINRVDNATSAGGPTPEKKPDYEEFRYLARLLRELQNQRTVELVHSKKTGSPNWLSAGISYFFSFLCSLRETKWLHWSLDCHRSVFYCTFFLENVIVTPPIQPLGCFKAFVCDRWEQKSLIDRVTKED